MPRPKRDGVGVKPTSFRLTEDALEAIGRLKGRLALPRSRVIELAIGHLERDLESGRIRGLTLSTVDPSEG